MEDAYVLISEKKLSSLNELLPLLEKVVQTGKPLLIIADDVEGEVMAALVVNKLRGSLKVAAVKAPAYGELRKAMLQDIALLTGGTVISDDLGLKLENLSLDMLGRAKKVTIDKQNTTIVGGAGKKADIEARIAQIKAQLERHDLPTEDDVDYDREKLAGAAGQADRRHRRDPGRRRHRDRGQGEEGPHPQRHARDARRDRGGHSAGRRRRLAAGEQSRSAISGPTTTIRMPASRSSGTRSPGRRGRSRSTPARTAPSSSPRSSRGTTTPMATMPSRANTGI